MTVKKLFILSIILLASVLLLTNIAASPYNRFTHDCVPNRKIDLSDKFDLIFGPELKAQEKQYFCPEGEHAVLTEKWETVNRYVQYATYAITIPVILCCGAILNDRRVRKKTEIAAKNSRRE